MNQFRDPLFYHRMDMPKYPPPKIVKIEDELSRETTKVVELKDSRGITRFKIALTDFDNSEYPQNDDLQTWDATYQVTVVSYCCKGDDQPIVLFQKEYDKYEEADAQFELLKQQYRSLINVETRASQDVRIYAERINYKIVDPDCCRNCIWSQVLPRDQQLFNDWKKHKNKRVCMNPEVNKIKNDFEPRDPMHRKDPQHPYADKTFHDHYHHFAKECEHFDISLAPYTQDDGICDNYRRDNK